jgi:hypothetical protein
MHSAAPELDVGRPGIQNTYGLGEGLGPSLVVPWPSTRKSSSATVIWLITSATRRAIGWLDPTHGHAVLAACARCAWVAAPAADGSAMVRLASSAAPARASAPRRPGRRRLPSDRRTTRRSQAGNILTSLGCGRAGPAGQRTTTAEPGSARQRSRESDQVRRPHGPESNNLLESNHRPASNHGLESNHLGVRTGEQGLEPQLRRPERRVLPLHHSPVLCVAVEPHRRV